MYHLKKKKHTNTVLPSVIMNTGGGVLMDVGGKLMGVGDTSKAKWTRVIYIGAAELYQFLLITFWIGSISFMPTLFKLEPNKYMWIYVLTEIFSLMLWFLTFAYADIKKLYHTTFRLLNIGVHTLTLAYTLFYVIGGSIWAAKLWHNVAYFPDDTHKGFQITYLAACGINVIVTGAEYIPMLKLFQMMFTKSGKVELLGKAGDSSELRADDF